MQQDASECWISSLCICHVTRTRCCKQRKKNLPNYQSGYFRIRRKMKVYKIDIYIERGCPVKKGKFIFTLVSFRNIWPFITLNKIFKYLWDWIKLLPPSYDAYNILLNIQENISNINDNCSECVWIISECTNFFYWEPRIYIKK